MVDVKSNYEPHRNGDHFIRANTPAGIHKEIAPLTREELHVLKTKIVDSKRLSQELIVKRQTDPATPLVWLQRAAAAVRILGLQIHVIQDRLTVLGREHSETKRKEERMRFERVFMQATFDLVGRDAYLKLTDETHARVAKMVEAEQQEESTVVDDANEHDFVRQEGERDDTCVRCDGRRRDVSGERCLNEGTAGCGGTGEVT